MRTISITKASLSEVIGCYLGRVFTSFLSTFDLALPRQITPPNSPPKMSLAELNIPWPMDCRSSWLARKSCKTNLLRRHESTNLKGFPQQLMASPIGSRHHSKRHGSFSDRWFQISTNGLVGGFNPSEKYESKLESSPNRDENKKYLKTPPSGCTDNLNYFPGGVLLPCRGSAILVGVQATNEKKTLPN